MKLNIFKKLAFFWGGGRGVWLNYFLRVMKFLSLNNVTIYRWQCSGRLCLSFVNWEEVIAEYWSACDVYHHQPTQYMTSGLTWRVVSPTFKHLCRLPTFSPIWYFFACLCFLIVSLLLHFSQVILMIRVKPVLSLLQAESHLWHVSLLVT